MTHITLEPENINVEPEISIVKPPLIKINEKEQKCKKKTVVNFCFLPQQLNDLYMYKMSYTQIQNVLSIQPCVHLYAIDLLIYLMRAYYL